MKNISILGSTGSIGTQALDIIRNNSDKFQVIGLTANKNIETLYKQILEFEPYAVAVSDSDSACKLKEMLGRTKVEIFTGDQGLSAIASMSEADTILTSVVGMVGLVPTLEAIKNDKKICLANKETLVSGGAVVKKALETSKSSIIPVDSEHCAIFQCLHCSSKKSEVEKIILTASGGPFRGNSIDELFNVSPSQALKHPNWNMGRKISIDSATLMNKGLEVIEAHWLFDMDFDRIDVIIHPESVIHSMVEYIDGSIIAEMGTADMRNPILYAFTYPEREKGIVEKLDFTKVRSLTFEKPDYTTFKSLRLAYNAGKEGGTMPAVLNAANEVAVDLFLKGAVKFLDIPDIVEEAMSEHSSINNPGLEDILETDRDTRNWVYNKLKVVI